MFIGFANMPFGLYQPPKDKIVFTPRAEVAQLVEQWTENPCVGGSSPPLGTILPNPCAVEHAAIEFLTDPTRAR